MVNGFRGDRYFLSNFAPSPIRIDFDGRQYVLATGEHAFHGMKVAVTSISKEEQHAFLAKLQADNNPNKAKYHGRSIRIDPARWDAMSYRCMERVIELKFTQNPDLMAKLRETGADELIEYNSWGDKLWGVDENTGVGKNQLGQILMAFRAQHSRKRILITGSREWSDRDRMFRALDEVVGSQPAVLVSGHARGADLMAEEWAVSRGHQVESHPADWESFGKRAGYVRNQLMADLGADIVVAFRVGASKGTTMMMNLVQKQGLPLRVEQEGEPPANEQKPAAPESGTATEAVLF